MQAISQCYGQHGMHSPSELLNSAVRDVHGHRDDEASQSAQAWPDALVTLLLLSFSG